MDRQMQKQSFLTYNSQIGKIKGLALAVHKGKEHQRSEENYAQAI